jgi:predicted NBD/HSP70 family sugar kinase
MKILVIDIGGSHVKLKVWGKARKVKFDSGNRLTPQRLMKQIAELAGDWKYDAVSIGLPAPVIHGKPAAEPPNLGKGWMRFDFEKHFKKPVKIINDAAMQALGSYRGGRMLFIGLGTGVGSALILDDIIVPLDLGDLAYSRDKTLWEVLGKAGRKQAGQKAWERAVNRVVRQLMTSFQADHVIIGGGNAKRLRRLPRGARRGHNDKAFAGGARLWRQSARFAKPQKHTWVIA